MRVVEEPNDCQDIPAQDVFSYDGGKPVIGDTFATNYRKYTVLGDGRVRERSGDTLVLGRYFYLTSGHTVAQTEYQNGKTVFRCLNCDHYRSATATSEAAKRYILGAFMNSECRGDRSI